MIIAEQFNQFEELLSKSSLPLLVMFYAPWCGPARLVNSALEKISTQMDQQLQIIKINSEEYSDLATYYQVHALPALVLFKQGQAVARIEAEQIENLISVECLTQRLQPLIEN